MKKRYLLFISFMLIVIAGCFNATLKDYQKEACTELPGGNVFKAIQENCVSCHKNDFKTKEDICARKSMIIDSVSKGRMPKMGKLYDHYKKTLVEWR